MGAQMISVSNFFFLTVIIGWVLVGGVAICLLIDIAHTVLRWPPR